MVAQLRAGKTIDQIAGAQAASVKQDVLAHLRTRLDRAVSRGRISAATETSLLARAGQRLDTLMAKNLAARLQHRAPAGSGASTAPAEAL